MKREKTIIDILNKIISLGMWKLVIICITLVPVAYLIYRVESFDSRINVMDTRISDRINEETAALNSTSNAMRADMLSIRDILSMHGASDSKHTEAINNLKQTWTKIEQLSGSLESKLKKLNKLENELQSHLKNQISMAKLIENHDRLAEKYIALENQFVLIEDARPYIGANIELPANAVEEQNLYVKMAKNELSKSELSEYILQSENWDLRMKAIDAYFIILDDEDIDFTIKTIIRLGTEFGDTGALAHDLLPNFNPYITKSNIHLLHKSILKYSPDDVTLSLLLRSVSNSISTSDEILANLRAYCVRKQLSDSLQLIDSLMAANNGVVPPEVSKTVD